MSIRKLSEQQRRRIQAIQQRRLAQAEHQQAQFITNTPLTTAPAQTGTVITHYGVAQIIETPANEYVRCVARQNLGALACGDQVLWQPAAEPYHGVITAIQPRRSLLARPLSGGRCKLLAANLDQIIIVVPAGVTLRLLALDRYLLVAQLTQIPAVIVISKVDQLTPAQWAEAVVALAHYSKIGYAVLWTSTQSGIGLDSLINILRDKTSIFIGPSGAGKSSLIQALLPDQAIRIQTVSSLTQQGRHTTTNSTLYHWPQGGDLIDSPGIRQFDWTPASAAELAAGFIEFRPYLGQCQFNNCRHLQESHCAILAAAAAGHIHPQRLASYQTLLLSN